MTAPGAGPGSGPTRQTRPRDQRRLTALARGLTAIMTIAASGRADVADDVRTVDQGLRALGATRTVVVPPRVMSSRETVPLALPPWATSDESGKSADCTTVTVLGALSTVFALRLSGTTSDPSGGDVLVSLAGAQMVSRCGAQRQALSELSLEMRSPRGIVETIVTRSARPPPSLGTLLPHRDPGFIPGPGRPPGAAPRPGPLAARAAAFEENWSEEGVDVKPRRLVPADESGAGRLILDLAPGCHRIVILGVDSDAPRGPDADDRVHDIDAELAWVTGDIAAVDRTDGPDANLTACTGTRELAVVAFAGAVPHGGAVLLQGDTDLPRGIPEDWGHAAAARIARGLVTRRAPPPDAPPTYSSLGVAGLTLLPLEVEPGQCYLAALALIEGSAKLVALTVTTGAVRSTAHTDESGSAAILTFCAGVSHHATLETELHGASLVSAVGVWPMGRRRLGEEAP